MSELNELNDLSTGISTNTQETGEERTISTVTFEIKSIHAQAQQMMLNFAIEIGRRLTEAKAMLEHGGWGEWLKNEVAFSKSTANNLMRIFEEYGDRQMCLFGAEAKSQSLRNLPYTKALKLLAVPEEEREEFLEEHNVEEMSSRELEKIIKERDKAKEETEIALSEAEKAITEAEQAKFDTSAALAEAERAKLDKEFIFKQLENAKLEKKRLETEAESFSQKALQLEQEMESLRNSPKEVMIETVVDEIAVQQAREETEQLLAVKINEMLQEKETAQQQAKEVQERLEQLSKEVAQQNQALEQEKEEAVSRCAELEKQLASLSSPDVATFKVHFQQVQEHINKMLDIVSNSTEEQVVGKLSQALQSVLESSLGAVKGQNHQEI